MTFNSLEKSNYHGQPAQLYKFRMGDRTWTYNTSDGPIEFTDPETGDLEVYEGLPISNDGMSHSADIANDEIKVTIPTSADFANLFIGTPPSETIWLIVRRKHYDSAEAPVLWSGTLKSGRRSNRVTLEVTGKTLLGSLNRIGLRLSWGRSCPHALYDRQCGVDPNAFAVTSAVSTVGPDWLTMSAAAGFANGWFSGGIVEFLGPHGTMERRGIESHVLGRITLLGTSEGIAADDLVTIYPGCERIMSVCVAKFNNRLNYGGITHLPNKSPFDGDPVF